MSKLVSLCQALSSIIKFKKEEEVGSSYNKQESYPCQTLQKKMDDQAAAATTADWAELTHEILINILSRLSIEDRWWRAMRVCKSWHEACKYPHLNSILDLESHFDKAADLPWFWTREFERRIDNILAKVVVWSAGSIVEIRVRHCSDRSLALVARGCPDLQVLSIMSCPHVSDAIMAEIASGCPKIKELDVSYCYEISHESLAIIGSRCPDLHILKRKLMSSWYPHPYTGIVPKEYLDARPEDGYEVAAAISKFMPRLTRLELGSTELRASDHKLISEACQDLRYLQYTEAWFPDGALYPWG